MRKKQILVMGLVVLAILAMSFILVMMTTGREAYGKEQQHTCPTCKGEKRIPCPGKTQLRSGSETYTAQCPSCKKNKAHHTIYYCTTCGLVNESWHCIKESGGCGYKRNSISYDGKHFILENENSTNNYHRFCTIPCPDCKATGKVNCTFGDWEQYNSTTHRRYCTERTCNNFEESNHRFINGVCRDCGYRCTHNWNSSTGKCDNCGETCSHIGGTHVNNGTCTRCGYKYQTHSKGTTVKYKDITGTTHTAYYECTFAGCTYTYNENAENHIITSWTNNGNGTHSGTCTKCGYKVTNNHNYGTDGKCKDCGATKPSTECEHVWVIEKNANNHWEKCTKCNNIRNMEAHTITTWVDNGNGTHSGTCTKCGYTVTKNHNYGTDGKCKDCGATKPVESCEHNWETAYDNTYHWDKCTKCGEIKNKAKHTMTAWKDNGNGTHSRTCTKCGYKMTENHNYNNGKCDDCGATKPSTECEHNWKIANDNTYHWNECTKCGEIKDKAKHTMTAWKNNGNGTHSKTCTKCGYKITENHNYNNDGKCDDCDATKPNTECNHDWKQKDDETNHWKECTKCGEIKDKAKHTVKEWKDNGDGTHSGNCTVCNRKITEKHEKGTDGKCTKCGATISNNNNNNGNNNNSGKNNTSNNVIPNTGANSSVIIGIVAFAAIAGIAYMRLKKLENN